jgi:thymidylate kinase
VTRSLTQERTGALEPRHSPAADVIRQLFACFAARGIQLCVLGRTDGLPDRPLGDLDVVVEYGCTEIIPSLLLEFVRLNNARLVQVLWHEHTAWYFVIVGRDPEGHLWFLHPDVCSSFRQRGRILLEPQELLARSRPALDVAGKPKGFHIPASDAEFAYYLLKKIGKQELTDEQAAHLCAVFRENPEGVRRWAKDLWPKGEANLICDAAASGDWSAFRAALPRLRRVLHLVFPLSLVDRLVELRRTIERILRPTGLWVVILGADGSGKSTILTRALGDLAPAFRRTEVVHLRRLFIARADAMAHRAGDPHRLPARGASGSVAKLALYAAAYIFGYWLKTRPALVRSTLVGFDRYYHDLFVDPRRYRYGGPIWLLRLVGLLVPKPDLWIVLEAPMQVLQARKAEVSPDESVRQCRAYHDLRNTLRDAHLIDASRPLEEVVRAVEDIILDHMARRTQRRLNLGRF